MKKRVIFVQQQLKARNLYLGEIDGKAGEDTMDALSLAADLDPDWSVRRKIVGYIQLLCLEHDISPGDVDGYWGHLTEDAFDELNFKLEHGVLPPVWRPEEIVIPNPNEWPVQYSDDFDDFYGDRGSHLVRINLPYPHKLSWNTSKVVRSYYCHLKVHDSLLRVLTKVLDHYGMDGIKDLRLDLWGGCYNERPIRGGTLWSMHSWGIAIDYDPTRNKLKWGADKASFARPEYNKWWEFWEEEGWVSLGRQRNFDWMHIQAAVL